METRDLLWTKNLGLELAKLLSQTPKPDSQIEPVFLDQNKELVKQNVKMLDFHSEEKSQEEAIKNKMNIQFSYNATKVQTPGGFKLVKSFPDGVISLRDFLHSAQDSFNSLTLIIEFAKDLVDAVNCFYEFETIHNDIRIENICFNKKENRFKLVPSHKSLQGQLNGPDAFNQDKLGFLLVLFEVTQVVSFDEFDPEKLESYFEKLVSKSSTTFVGMLRSAQSIEQIRFDKTMKIHQSLRQSQEDQITDSRPPAEKSVHPKELESIPSLKILLKMFYPEITEEQCEVIERNLRSEKMTYALGKTMQLNNINTNSIEEACTKAKKSLGFEELEGVVENKILLKYPSPEEINGLSITLKFVKEYLNSIVAEFERFESRMRANTGESAQNKQIFLQYPNSQKINEFYEGRQRKQFFQIWNEAEEKIHQLAEECFDLDRKLISQELKYFLFSKTESGKYPDPEEMQRIGNTAKQFFAYFVVIRGIWKKLQAEVKERMKEVQELDLKETVSILRSVGGNEKEVLIPGLIEIKMLNEAQKDDPSLLSTYYHDFVSLSKKVNPSQGRKILREEVEHYASGCVLNYHFWCLKHVKSNQDVLNIFNQGNYIIDTYGSDLEPHQLYRIHRTIPDQETLRKSQEIMESIQAGQNSNKLLFNILDQLASDLEARVVFTEREGSRELDSLHALGTGGLSDKFLKVTLTDLDEKDFQKMAEDPTYAEKIYKQFKEVVITSKIFGPNHTNKIEIVAIECNSPATAVILIGSNVVEPINLSEFGKNVTIKQTPIIKYLSINANHFDTKGNMHWSENHIDSEPRGGLDYFFPKGWKGYGLKVLGKYPDDKWLTQWDHTGWAIGYHGVGTTREENPGVVIGKILDSDLKAGLGQAYKDDNDANPLLGWFSRRKVGTGVYFGKKISISENGYTRVVTLKDKSQYKVLLQCRLNPKEVRIPETQKDYYVVPEGHARPYRILVKQVKKKNPSQSGAL